MEFYIQLVLLWCLWIGYILAFASMELDSQNNAWQTAPPTIIIIVWVCVSRIDDDALSAVIWKQIEQRTLWQRAVHSQDSFPTSPSYTLHGP